MPTLQKTKSKTRILIIFTFFFRHENILILSYTLSLNTIMIYSDPMRIWIRPNLKNRIRIWQYFENWIERKNPNPDFFHTQIFPVWGTIIISSKIYSRWHILQKIIFYFVYFFDLFCIFYLHEMLTKAECWKISQLCRKTTNQLILSPNSFCCPNSLKHDIHSIKILFFKKIILLKKRFERVNIRSKKYYHYNYFSQIMMILHFIMEF